MTQVNQLVGVWRIVSFQVEIEGVKKSQDVYDKQPSGFLILTDEGRMMALITAGERTKDASSAALFDCMTAYSGRYRLNDDRLVTIVDSAWHPAWIGTEQIRFVKLDGHTLSLSSPLQEHPKFPGKSVRGVAIWQREEAVF
jgi:Lipocalin-like domain